MRIIAVLVAFVALMAPASAQCDPRGVASVGGEIQNIERVGDLLYASFHVNSSTGVVKTFDIADPAGPVPLAQLNTVYFPGELLAHGDTLYIATGDLTIADPPVTQGVLQSEVTGFDVHGDAVVVADAGGVRLQTLSDVGANGSQLGSLSSFSDPRLVRAADGFAYVIDDRGLKVFDLSEPGNPVRINILPNETNGHTARTEGSNLYVPGLGVFDLTDPDNSVRVGDLGFYEDIELEDGRIYAAAYSTTTPDFSVIDARHPPALSVVGVLDFNGDPLADVDANGVLNLDDVAVFAQGFLAGCP